MGYMDTLEDEASNLRGKLIKETDEVAFSSFYMKFKNTLEDIRIALWGYIAKDYNSIEECRHHSILDRYIDFDDETGQVTDHALAKILKLDAPLKKYCIDHTENDGIVGMLKYKKTLHKKDLIAKALLLV